LLVLRFFLLAELRRTTYNVEIYKKIRINKSIYDELNEVDYMKLYTWRYYNKIEYIIQIKL